MTATLVLGGVHSGKARYAVGLLPKDDPVTLIVPTPKAGDGSEAVTALSHWTRIDTDDVTRTILRGRTPVIVDRLTPWAISLIDAADARDDLTKALDVVTGAGEELAALCLGVPYDVVLIGDEFNAAPSSGKSKDHVLQAAVGRLNQVVGAELPRVVLVSGGRALDLSDAPKVR